jgi:hypothetical protein
MYDIKEMSKLPYCFLTIFSRFLIILFSTFNDRIRLDVGGNFWIWIRHSRLMSWFDKAVGILICSVTKLFHFAIFKWAWTYLCLSSKKELYNILVFTNTFSFYYVIFTEAIICNFFELVANVFFCQNDGSVFSYWLMNYIICLWFTGRFV